MPRSLSILLLFLLLRLLPLCLSSPSSANSLEFNTPKCANVSIPYPFGFSMNNYTLGLLPLSSAFTITCYERRGPLLSINNKEYRVLSISLPDGYVSIVGPAIAWRCNRSSSSTSVLSLEGTPFTFSDKRNKFTAVGCDAMAMIRSGAGSNRGEYSGGCVSFCATKESIIDGSCSGVGCCQASVPRGLRKLDLEFKSIRNLTGSTKDDSGEPCSKAFIVDQDSYVFSLNNLLGDPRDQHLPVVLEWSIGNSSCKEAKHSLRSACMPNTTCYDAPNGIGYRCRCSPGFTGNPYMNGTDGCQDINECEDMNNNPCVHKCMNTMGGFNCACPLGMTGDGKKQGSGCSRTETPEIALVAGLALLVSFLVLGFWTYWLVKKRRLAKQKQRYFLQNGGLLLQQQIFSQGAPARIFTSSELDKSTNNFSEDHIIGRGGYGTVYKGQLSDQTVVAIKKSRLVDQSQMEQFINEVVILSQINHKNVVKLLGCCLETEVPLLVYEFISNGALSHHLNNTTSPLMPWEDRLRIAVEIASALAYLHMATNLPIIHRDVKSANILLDESYTAKVSDFGASRLVPYNQTHVTTLVQGTLGYLDPEYFHTSQLTEKSDVYSFGVVLVELLTREKPISYCRPEERRNLASHFTMLFEQNCLMEIVDSAVANEAGARHVNVVAHLALKCLRLKGEERPRMIEVAIELEALRRLMKQHTAQKSKEPQLLQEEARCYGQMHVGEPWSLCRNDMVKDESMGSSLLSYMDLPC